MIVDELQIKILDNVAEVICIGIRPIVKNSLFLLDEMDADENGEARHQIKEGFAYDYEISPGYEFDIIDGVITPNKFNSSTGRITPGNYVGTLILLINKCKQPDWQANIKLEVQSTKAAYRTDYRKMLSDIAEFSVDLIFQHSSPVSQIVLSDFSSISKNNYQKFSFVQSILDSSEFNESIGEILNAPSVRWEEFDSIKDIRGVKRFGSKELRQISTLQNRFSVSYDNYFTSNNIQSLPSKICIKTKKESYDTHENRFIKHALTSFLRFVEGISVSAPELSKIKNEALNLTEKLENILSQKLFESVSEPKSLHLNSPLLHNKHGYKELFKIWLMFDLAAKLSWSGSDDFYSINKRDVAVLYEYWCFFKLLMIVRKIFKISVGDNLFIETADSFGFQLNKGKCLNINGVCNEFSKPINVQFSFNRSFGGNNIYPFSGSWTKSMRPDYTISLWPTGMEQNEAELKELIVHIHFDAKYKLESAVNIFDDSSAANEERLESNPIMEEVISNSDTFKRNDLLKMHAYKDAIRRSAGAYVIYPGQSNESYIKYSFHEILPGLGAFPLNPSSLPGNENALEEFIQEVADHFCKTESQSMLSAKAIYEIHNQKPLT